VLQRRPQVRFMPSWIQRKHSGGLFLLSIEFRGRCIVDYLLWMYSYMLGDTRRWPDTVRSRLEDVEQESVLLFESASRREQVSGLSFGPTIHF